MADCYEVYEATQAAAMQNTSSAMADTSHSGPKFRPGSAQENPNHYSAPPPPAAFVFSDDQQAAIAQVDRLCAQAQAAINATEGGPK